MCQNFELAPSLYIHLTSTRYLVFRVCYYPALYTLFTHAIMQSDEMALLKGLALQVNLFKIRVGVGFL